jgi:hypothetical protein
MLMLRVLVVLLLSAHVFVEGRFPVFTATGTYYEVGRQIGAQSRDLLELRLSRPGLNATIKPFAASPTGRTMIANFKAKTSALFPHLMDELAGIAAGSGVPFEDIFLLNCLDEVETYISLSETYSARQQPHSHGSAVRRTPHCTDILTNSQTPAWGHNEDGDYHDVHTNYFTNVTIVDAKDRTKVLERFVAFTYAGTVAGDAYGWNKDGVLFSQNAVFAVSLNYFGAPGQVAARASYSARSIDDAIAIINRAQSANSFNLNLATTRGTRMVNIEVDPLGASSVHEVQPYGRYPAVAPFVNCTIPPYYFYHTNEYKILATPCFDDPSSDHRDRVLASYPAPNATADIRKMLGDTSDHQYPIYRNGAAPDTGTVTLTTVVYDLSTFTAHIFDSNPRDNTPLAVWNLW